jgi:hypothetical protein
VNSHFSHLSRTAKGTRERTLAASPLARASVFPERCASTKNAHVTDGSPRHAQLSDSAFFESLMTSNRRGLVGK